MSTPEEQIANYFALAGIRHIVAVPCRYIAGLLNVLSKDQRFALLYATREEEGVAIAGGVHLGGGKAVVLMQNSGLGNMVNVYKSLYTYYNLPACLFISQRGDEFDDVDAQRPMGSITGALLKVMDIACSELRVKEDMSKIPEGLRRFTQRSKSIAFIARKSLWMQP
jgi:sulfopyruvate decarboxylase alpha subunit